MRGKKVTLSVKPVTVTRYIVIGDDNVRRSPFFNHEETAERRRVKLQEQMDRMNDPDAVAANLREELAGL